MEQQIAELVLERGRLAVAQRLIQLERFFDQVGTQRRAGLDAIPRTPGAQVAHQRQRTG